MKALPKYLASFRVGEYTQQALTALAISTVQTALTLPLERAKISSACTGRALSLRQTIRQGSSGFTLYWAKTSINWVFILTAQKYLRKKAMARTGRPLTLSNLALIGAQIGFMVSIISAPLERATTLKLAKTQKISWTLQAYRGWPLYALSFVIHNIATVILIDWLERKRG